MSKIIKIKDADFSANSFIHIHTREYIFDVTRQIKDYTNGIAHTSPNVDNNFFIPIDLEENDVIEISLNERPDVQIDLTLIETDQEVIFSPPNFSYIYHSSDQNLSSTIQIDSSMLKYNFIMIYCSNNCVNNTSVLTIKHSRLV